MSDVMRPPAWLDQEEIEPRKKPVQREHSFQCWTHRFLKAVIMPPMFVTAIDASSRDMTNVARVAKMKARGVVFGVPDHYACQSLISAHRSLWIELKRGAGVSETQKAVHRSLSAAGQHVAVCRSMFDVLQALRDAGFALHGNADNLAAEYEARVEASVGAAPKRKGGKARAPKPSSGRLRQVAALRSRVLF